MAGLVILAVSCLGALVGRGRFRFSDANRALMVQCILPAPGLRDGHPRQRTVKARISESAF